MKKNWLSSVIFAAVMMVCSVTYANPSMDTGVLNTDPVYAPVTLFDTDPLFAPAAKSNNDGFERSLSVAYFQLNVDNRIPKTVLACGSLSELDDTPTKIPIVI